MNYDHYKMNKDILPVDDNFPEFSHLLWQFGAPLFSTSGKVVVAATMLFQ